LTNHEFESRGVNGFVTNCLSNAVRWVKSKLLSKNG